MIRTEYDAKGQPIAENYEDHLIESLKDPVYVKEYLNAALEDEDYRVFLLALRDVAAAFGITHLASTSNLNRENIYKMLSAKGNPRISSVVALLRAIGVQLKTEITPPIRRPVRTASRKHVVSLQKPDRKGGLTVQKPAR